MGDIRVTCKTADSLPYEQIEPLQGRLKKRTGEQVEKICRSVIKHGWAFPEFIRQNEGHNYCLDGHGRQAAIPRLIETVAMKDPITAGTVYWLDNRVDGGDILSQRFIHVSPAEDHHALWRRLFDLGVDMLSAAVSALASGHAVREPQNQKYATWEPPFDGHARLHRPELLTITGTIAKSENHCIIGRAACGVKYPCEGCRFQERNPLCAHGLWKCPERNEKCNSACVWFNGNENFGRNNAETEAVCPILKTL